VTLYARADDDAVEGSARITIAANETDILDERSVTATEDEPGEALTIQFAEWTDSQQVTAEGTVQIELDPDNYDFPLGRNGVLTARAITVAQMLKGKAYLSITNYPLRPACPCSIDDCSCSLHACYERENPDDTILRVDGRIDWDCAQPCASYHFTMILPFLDAYTFATSCGGQAAGRSYSAELTP
jgi:hypothetical protein